MAYSHSVNNMRGLFSERPAPPSTEPQSRLKADSSNVPRTFHRTRATCDGGSMSSGTSNRISPCDRIGSETRAFPTGELAASGVRGGDDPSGPSNSGRVESLIPYKSGSFVPPPLGATHPGTRSSLDMTAGPVPRRVINRHLLSSQP